MPVQFDEEARRLLDAKSFAVVSTLLPKGGPQTSVIRVKRDGDAVLFTTTSHRQKARNIAKDGRVSLTVLDSDNPHHSLEIRGRAIIPEPERRLPYELTHKFLRADPPTDPEGAERFIVRVVPERVIALTA